MLSTLCICRSSCGVLKTCFGENDLELYCGSLPLTVHGWKKDPVVSLREATKKLNPLNEYEVGRCNCKSGCQGQKCSCRKLGSPCTSKCHQGTSCSNCPPSPMETPAKRRKVSCSSAAKSLVLQKQQSKHKSTAQTPTVIDLTFERDTNETSSTGTHKKKVDTWVKVEDICLTTADQGILLHPTAWMNDNILAAGQRLLQRQTGAHGLQPPCIGQICAFDIQQGHFIQIVNNGHAHWLTISTIGAADGTVNVYDSLYMSVSSFVKEQVAAIVHTDKKEITLNFIDVQMQRGTCDCGLFSLAFATCLANGFLPEKQLFDQGKMRNHLYECLQKGELTMFPVMKERTLKKVIRAVDTVPVFCDCRMPEDSSMVQCCNCDEWYHIPCVDVPKAALENSAEPWYCNNC